MTQPERITGADVLQIIQKRLTALQLEVVSLEAERDRARAERDKYRELAKWLRASRDKWKQRATLVEPPGYVRMEHRPSSVRYATDEERQAARRESARQSKRRAKVAA